MRTLFALTMFVGIFAGETFAAAQELPIDKFLPEIWKDLDQKKGRWGQTRRLVGQFRQAKIAG